VFQAERPHLIAGRAEEHEALAFAGIGESRVFAEEP
jgi:hypothetical protein